jgi:hypothetical protein
MIIDPTYFTGKINLPQRGNSDGLVLLQQFIDQYEPEFLQETLGYDLWKAFMTGLQEPVIDAKWISLLNGAEYTHNNRTSKWIGFLPLSAGASMDVDGGNKIDLTVGDGGAYDPIPGSSSMTLPPDFVGAVFDIEVRGTGTLKPAEYTVTGNTLTLTGGMLFNNGAVIFLRKATALTIGSTTTLKISPIANYVYYKFRENEASTTTLIGEVVSSTDNNRTIAPVDKMVAAWNQMVDWLQDLLGFLHVNVADYPEWKSPCSWSGYWRWYRYQPDVYNYINGFDI